MKLATISRRRSLNDLLGMISLRQIFIQLNRNPCGEDQQAKLFRALLRDFPEPLPEFNHSCLKLNNQIHQ